MTDALKLGVADSTSAPRIRRLNRLPIIVAIALVVLFLAVIFYGLTSRGLRFGDRDSGFTPGSQPASTRGSADARGARRNHRRTGPANLPARADRTKGASPQSLRSTGTCHRTPSCAAART